MLSNIVKGIFDNQSRELGLGSITVGGVERASTQISNQVFATQLFSPQNVSQSLSTSRSNKVILSIGFGVVAAIACYYLYKKSIKSSEDVSSKRNNSTTNSIATGLGVGAVLVGYTALSQNNPSITTGHIIGAIDRHAISFMNNP